MDLDAVAGLHDDYRTLIDFWRAKKPADKPAPCLHDVDLMDLYAIASKLVIVDIETGTGGERAYRWRFAGTALRDFIGIELTGRYLHDTADETTNRDTAAIYAEIARNGGHHYWERKLGLKDRDRSFLSYSRLILPLLGGDGTVRHFIALYVLPRRRGPQDDHKPGTWDLVPEE
ncbi:MAG: PAS domain-containing protein [Rhodospirillales bacterium]